MKVQFRSYKPEKKKKLASLFSVQSLLSGMAPDLPLLYCVFGLTLFGWIMVYSSSALMAESRYHDQYFFLKRQMAWSCIAMLFFLAASNIPLRVWQRFTKPIYLITAILLILVLMFGPTIAGAKRWFRFGFGSFQPSEMAKLAVVLMVADYLDRRQSRLKEFKRGLLPLLCLVGVPVGLIVIEPDLGTPVLMSMVCLALLVLGGAKWKHLFVMGLSLLPLMVLAVIKVKYRLARFFAFLDPWADPQGAGYQLVQSLLAMGSGGLFGRGLGNSKLKISSLPDAHTDFVFSVLGEELGLVGTLVCAGLFFFLCMRGLRIAKKAPTLYARLLAAGISLMIGLQALINMGVACGLFPTKGMPLPFISFGGSSLVFLFTSVGILSHISKLAPAMSAEPK